MLIFLFSKEKIPAQFKDKILVPFCVESALSGVMQKVEAEQVMVYQRKFEVKKSWRNKKIKLMFEAVDYEATVYVNDVEVGSHKGGTSNMSNHEHCVLLYLIGYDAFSFDITKHLNDQTEQIIKVLVTDPTEKQVCQF